MPATTPTYGITYPVSTDKVADGAAAIQSTAETVERELTALDGRVTTQLSDQDAAVTAQLAAQDAEHAAALGYRRLFLHTGGY